MKKVKSLPKGEQTIELPSPGFDSGLSVFEALKRRKTVREFSAKEIPVQILSNILWAARGINRKRGPFGTAGITAASASNSQEIEVYVAMREATYLYQARTHSLSKIVDCDLRAYAIGKGQQSPGTKAPIRLIYVADMEKFKSAGFQEPGLHDPEIQKSYYYIDTGMVAANVYLAAMACGLSAWFHNCDKTVAEKLGLKPTEHPLFGQTIGYPLKD